MRVLIATAMYPTLENPAFGSFVRTQVESLKQAGVDIELFILSGSSRKLMYPRGIFQLRRRLTDNSIDLIHAHYSYMGMVARTQWKVPVIVTYHGSDLLGCVDVHGNNRVWGNLDAAASQLLGQVVDAVIVQSKEMASKFKRKDVYIIPCEVDLKLFRPIEREHARAILGLDSYRKYLLFAANPQLSVKRFPLAKAVADHLHQRDPSVELLVVYKEPQDRLALYMSACDALVFPSYKEGSPNIVKQAMACNLPIVATDVGDVQEIIGGTKHCYICDPSVDNFTENLAHILACRERTQGREQVNHLDRAAVAQKLIQVYRETLRKRSSFQMGRQSFLWKK